MAAQKQVRSYIDKSRGYKPVPGREAVKDEDMATQDKVSPETAYANLVVDPGKSISPADILTLQQTAGNQAVQKLLANRIEQASSSGSYPKSVTQPKPETGKLDDFYYEQDADRVAYMGTKTARSQMVGRSDVVSRKDDEHEKEITVTNATGMYAWLNNFLNDFIES